MRISEVSLATLDRLVAIAKGWRITADRGEWVDPQGVLQYHPAICYDPTSDWSLAGPIIDREHISIEYRHGAEPWYAYFGPHEKAGLNWYGPAHYGATPLIAAMRAFVHIKLGDPLPAEAIDGL